MYPYYSQKLTLLWTTFCLCILFATLGGILGYVLELSFRKDTLHLQLESSQLMFDYFALQLLTGIVILVLIEVLIVPIFPRDGCSSSYVARGLFITMFYALQLTMFIRMTRWIYA